MSIRKLPDGEEGQQLIKEVPTASYGKLEAWAKEYKYANVDSFLRSMRSVMGVRREQPIAETEEPIILSLPPVKLFDYKAKKRKRGDEEIAILHTGDGHACKITKSYNKEIYRQRMETMFKSIMTIVGLHRNMYPIRKLHIINTGDNIQGENPYQGSRLGDVESMGARDQVKKVAVPMWNDVIGSLKQNFEEVIFDGYPGNHGHDRLAPETSAYDLLLYDMLEQGIGQHKGITIRGHETFGDILEIEGFRMFCFHGKEIPCTQGVPFFALTKKLQSWYIQYGGFNYAFGGHYHKRIEDEVTSKFEYFMVGTLVSDDDWAIRKLGISSSPSQSLYGLHSHFGITWRYPLQVVDKAFLPKKGVIK